jgi:hypothetical protein
MYYMKWLHLLGLGIRIETKGVASPPTSMGALAHYQQWQDSQKKK